MIYELWSLHGVPHALREAMRSGVPEAHDFSGVRRCGASFDEKWPRGAKPDFEHEDFMNAWAPQGAPTTMSEAF